MVHGDRIRAWVITGLTISLLVGCGVALSPPPEATAVVASSTISVSPTLVVSTSSPTPQPTSSPVPPPTSSPTPQPTPSPTLRPRPTATYTATPHAVVTLIVLECLNTFCPPPDLDQQAQVAAEQQPDILDSRALDEIYVRLVYDPTQLTEQQAIQFFVDITRLEVEVAQ